MSWPDRPRQVGTWVKIPTPEVIETLAAGGLDFVAIDGEHGAVDRRTMSSLVGLAKAIGLSVLVRVAGHHADQLLPPLDAGADALLLSHVDGADDALAVVDAGRFPPLGRRGGSLATRAGGWGVTDVAELVRRGNDDVALIAQIETPAAVAAVDHILSTKGLDGVFIGTFDLALTSGLAQEDAEFSAMVARVEAAAQPYTLGGVAATTTTAARMLDDGYNFVLVSADTSMLRTAAAALVQGCAHDR